MVFLFCRLTVGFSGVSGDFQRLHVKKSRLLGVNRANQLFGFDLLLLLFHWERSGIHLERAVNEFPLDMFSHLTNFQFAIMINILWNYCFLWSTWVLYIICISATALEISVPSTNRCFWWSRVRITVFKQMLSLYVIFYY